MVSYIKNKKTRDGLKCPMGWGQIGARVKDSEGAGVKLRSPSPIIQNAKNLQITKSKPTIKATPQINPPESIFEVRSQRSRLYRLAQATTRILP